MVDKERLRKTREGYTQVKAMVDNWKLWWISEVYGYGYGRKGNALVNKGSQW